MWSLALLVGCGPALCLQRPLLQPRLLPPVRPAARLARHPLATVALEQEDGDGPLQRPVPQALLCTAGYLAHLLVLSRRGLRIGSVDLGLDTLTGGVVVLAAVANRVRNGRTPIPGWLSGASPVEEAGLCADFSAEVPRQKVKLLATAALLLVLPVLFSAFVLPLMDAIVLVLAIIFPLTDASLDGVRLLVAQTILYGVLLKFIQVRHPDFFGSKVTAHQIIKLSWLTTI